MNELTTEKYVTVKELADVLNVESSTITRTVKKLDAVLHSVRKNSQGGYLFTEEQATKIKQEIAGHHNLGSRQIDSVTTEYEENQMIAEAMSILQRRMNDYKNRMEKAEKEIEKLTPAANFAYQLCDSKDTIDIGECAKVINRKIGRNNLFDFLRRKGVLQRDNIPYQKFIDAGYFRVIETKYTTSNGDTKINLKTVVFQKGVAFINKLLEKESI